MTQIFSIDNWAAKSAAEKMKAKENDNLSPQERVYQERRYTWNNYNLVLNVLKIATVALIAIGAVLAMKAVLVLALIPGLMAYQVQKSINALGSRTEGRPENYIGSDLHNQDVRAWLGLPQKPEAKKEKEKAPEAWTIAHTVFGLPVWHRSAEVGKDAVYEKSLGVPPSMKAIGEALETVDKSIEEELRQTEYSDDFSNQAYHAGVRAAMNLFEVAFRPLKA